MVKNMEPLCPRRSILLVFKPEWFLAFTGLPLTRLIIKGFSDYVPSMSQTYENSDLKSNPRVSNNRKLVIPYTILEINMVALCHIQRFSGTESNQIRNSLHS